MISIIVCSIYPDKLEQLRQSIEATVGDASYEFIPIDNRKQPRSIAQVYNKGANLAKGECLCFVHEDVIFHTKGWCETIEKKLQEPDCGVIGFTGSWYKSKTLSGWSTHKSVDISSFIQSGNGKQKEFHLGELRAGYEPCATVDGFCLFVSRSHWQDHPFDEQLITSFHCYDLDLCLTMLHAGLTNYVCHDAMLEHRSRGTFSTDWVTATIALHQKWQAQLPVAIAHSITPEKINHLENLARVTFCKQLIKSTYPMGATYRFIWKAKREGLPLSKACKLICKLIYYRVRRSR